LVDALAAELLEIFLSVLPEKKFSVTQTPKGVSFNTCAPENAR